MLWLHMGMPKTGTTALQGFLRRKHSVMNEIGLHYMETGRRRLDGGTRLAISHNIVAFHINQSADPLDPFRSAMTTEYDAHADQTCVVSSEMFYSCNLNRLTEVFADIPSRALTITYYCRRYSDFFEADYKQRAKAGRLSNGGTEYIRQQLDLIRNQPERLSFSAKLAEIRTAFPGVTVAPLLYDRSGMVRGNVVDDFLSRIGTPLAEEVSVGALSNPSQSRAASEAFGVISRALGRKKSRQLRRISVDDPVMVRRNDVLEPDERAWLDEFVAKQDTAFQQEFFPDRPELFTPTKLSDEDKMFRRDTPEEYEALRKASEIVFRLALDV
ncbi:hypothetical protein [Ruegeria atlantica]|uniref:Sulfotransferase family protein n=1 Tax=Ruegeria atlantica TaxID=81569 RepID=A0A0P1EF55_9RHOB|nr:hypothetical protein [Ruegeria atlantica]CUH48082.1 hypothetical protein RUA4292_02260 [Ruegeria atlantica]